MHVLKFISFSEVNDAKLFGLSGLCAFFLAFEATSGLASVNGFL